MGACKSEELRETMYCHFAFSVIEDFHSLHHGRGHGFDGTADYHRRHFGPETKVLSVWLVLHDICLLLRMASGKVLYTDCGRVKLS